MKRRNAEPADPSGATEARKQRLAAVVDVPPAALPANRVATPRSEVVAAGHALRDTVPRRSHATWKPAKHRDPIGLLQAEDPQRVASLVPVRYGRMLQSPFAFFRGSAAIMAADVAQTPVTGITVQACGDCHLSNFGGFATPERNIVFDVNDFDETLPAPWEWDIKRLATSFVLAARTNGLSDGKGRTAAEACVRSYRKRLRAYGDMHPLEVWYARIDADDVLNIMPPEERGHTKQRVEKAAATRGSELDYPKLTAVTGGQVGIVDNPPLIYHPEQTRSKSFPDVVLDALRSYQETLPEDRRFLLDQYRYVDAAVKVVGVGSVGTFCWIVLLVSGSNDPLFLQFKEADASVLEPYAGKSAYEHHGQRVVVGQRLMQAASDMFLGWTTGRLENRQYYVRQLRDAKIKPLVETFDADLLERYGRLCGWALARAHAKAGDPLKISGYLGSSDRFDDALGEFAVAYADQAERDYDALKTAVRSGRLDVAQE